MSERETSIPTEALGDVGYLSRSNHRVAILETLARVPSSRGELEEKTGSSRATVDRIVNELEDRGWAVRRTDGEYEATPTGAQLAAQFRSLLVVSVSKV